GESLAGARRQVLERSRQHRVENEEVDRVASQDRARVLDPSSWSHSGKGQAAGHGPFWFAARLANNSFPRGARGLGDPLRFWVPPGRRRFSSPKLLVAGDYRFPLPVSRPVALTSASR